MGTSDRQQHGRAGRNAHLELHNGCAGTCGRRARTPRAAQAASSFGAWSIVVQDRAEAAVLGEQRIAAVADEVEVECLVGLSLAVALDFDGNRLRRLAGGEG